MDNRFQPRLLVPGASGIPSHMRVSDDPHVYAEFADPRVTAVVCVPEWPVPVQQAFTRLAKKAARDDPQKHSKSNGAFMGTPGLSGENKRMLTFVMEQTYNWMYPVVSSMPGRLQEQIVLEVTNRQQDMLKAFALVAAPGRRIIAERHYKPFGPSHGYGKFVFHPTRPSARYAHKDFGPTAIFAPRHGTILVDQDGLDIEKLTLKLKDGQGRPARGIPQRHLAGRLWRAPDGSFVIMRGHEENSRPQFHFFPYVAHDTLRHKLIAFSPPS